MSGCCFCEPYENDRVVCEGRKCSVSGEVCWNWKDSEAVSKCVVYLKEKKNS